MNKDAVIQEMLEVLRKLPEEKIVEVSHYVQFLLKKMDDLELDKGMEKMATESETFKFLKDEPDIYTLNDLKEVYGKQG